MRWVIPLSDNRHLPLLTHGRQLREV
jgi:hypothetical protein